MRIGVIGINHKQASVSLRENLAKACQRHFILGAFDQKTQVGILLTTCNRTEIYFTALDLPATHGYLLNLLRDEVVEEFDQKVYSYFGPDCFLHLARVTAGLDSAIIAETEIQGQVKAAYEHASATLSLPHELHYLFQKALKIGKDVRSAIPLGRGVPDLEHAVYAAGLQAFPNDHSVRLLFVGASEVNCKILSFLKNKPMLQMTLCNRSSAHAQGIAEKFGLSLLDWSSLNQWPSYDWVIFGTKAPYYLATGKDLPHEQCSRKLVIDLSVPRNVDPQIALNPKVTVLNIDQINQILRARRHQIGHMLAHADSFAVKAARRHCENFNRKERFREQGCALPAFA